MPWGVLAAGVAAAGSIAASDIQGDAAGDSLDLQRDMWQQTRADLAPYRDIGRGAVDTLSMGLGANGEFNRNFSMADFVADPGYAFRVSEGQRALENSASARSGQLSGAALRAATEFGQNMGSQEYGNAYTRFHNERQLRFQRLRDVVGIGESAAAGQAAANSGYAAGGANAIEGRGNAAAAGTVGAANAISGLLGSYYNDQQPGISGGTKNGSSVGGAVLTKTGSAYG